MSQIVVCKPKNIGPDDDDYVLDAEGSVRVFDDLEQAKQELRDAGYRSEELRRMTFLRSCGICRRCRSPLFKSLIPGYKYQCFTCDEDFCGFEQEV